VVENGDIIRIVPRRKHRHWWMGRPRRAQGKWRPRGNDYRRVRWRFAQNVGGAGRSGHSSGRQSRNACLCRHLIRLSGLTAAEMRAAEAALFARGVPDIR
jgi:hypothetical protein